MIISNAHISVAAQHEYREEHRLTERLDFWVGDRQSSIEPTDEAVRWREQVDISAAGSLLALRRHEQSLNLNTQMDSRSRVNLMILQAMYEAITGRPLQVVEPADLQADAKGQTLNLDTSSTTASSATNSPTPPSAGYGMVYERHERYHEQEKLQFQAQGIIRTQDGREIAFTTKMTMSREYIEESNLVVRAGDAVKIDPLVINFDGRGAELSQTRFAFDLDNNGTSEQIASLRSGSGFLALDRNGDGTINNGSELFGPQTGKGFAELAAYDEDGNQFIDEGDSIYHQLRIWMLNDDGSTQLAALGDKQIGAIFLGHITTPFQLNDSANNSLGEVANSSIYIAEDGQVGTVQEIHLTV